MEQDYQRLLFWLASCWEDCMSYKMEVPTLRQDVVNSSACVAFRSHL